ncbi:MAG: GFA family protein [Pseudomonadota bacterium]
MADWKLPMEGGCRCGRIRFAITAPPMFTALCHCTGCQKMTGGAYSVSVAVPQGGFAVMAGDPVIGGLHGDRLHHHHCDYCKSWVYTDFEPAMGFVNVRATMLDDPSWVTPFIENYTSEALPWAVVGGATHSFEKFPSMEQFQPLLAEFAAL